MLSTVKNDSKCLKIKHTPHLQGPVKFGFHPYKSDTYVFSLYVLGGFRIGWRLF